LGIRAAMAAYFIFRKKIVVVSEFSPIDTELETAQINIHDDGNITQENPLFNDENLTGKENGFDEDQNLGYSI
jgi:hypothetical protein